MSNHRAPRRAQAIVQRAPETKAALEVLRSIPDAETSELTEGARSWFMVPDPATEDSDYDSYEESVRDDRAREVAPRVTRIFRDESMESGISPYCRLHGKSDMSYHIKYPTRCQLSDKTSMSRLIVHLAHGRFNGTKFTDVCPMTIFN